jgi:hypothetical protein
VSVPSSRSESLDARKPGVVGRRLVKDKEEGNCNLEMEGLEEVFANIGFIFSL